jgi:phosphate transport system protein
MSVAAQIAHETAYENVVARCERAFEVAYNGAAALADALAGSAEPSFRAVSAAEATLDKIDSEVDSSVTAAIGDVSPAQARDLLCCLKIVLDLERIGDLLASVGSCARALGDRLPFGDVGELIQIVSVLEKMLCDVRDSFKKRDVKPAVTALRSDAEIDRMRNLLMIRHLEEAQVRITQDSVQVLFMVQALERAGDHVKNIAEEICHSITGRPMRHILRVTDRCDEQKYLEWLREHYSPASGNRKPSQEEDGSNGLKFSGERR